MLDYLWLFTFAFLAATVVPAVAEVIFVGLLADGRDPFWLWAFASVGNTLGACVNWAMAGWLLRYRNRRWFPLPPAQLERAQRWFVRWGVWSLLLSWLPVAGDAVTFVAGLMKVRWPIFLLLTFLGKSARYAVLLALLTGAFRWLEA